MNIIQAIILSIVEGISEFLPISSTGHLILTSRLMSIPQTEFTKSFEIFIQMGAILSVAILYYEKLTRSKTLLLKLLAAFLPTAIVGLLFYRFIKTYLLGNSEITTAALFLGGVVIIIFELFYKERKSDIETLEEISLKKAFLVGLFQSISVIPGVSRAAATILGGLFLRLNRKTAVEFSFLLALPTVFAATALDFSQSQFKFSQAEWLILLLGLIVSFITAYSTIKYLLKFIRTKNFISFGVYRIIISILFWFLILRNG